MLAPELYLRLHSLCRVAGPDDLEDLCERCRDSVDTLCSSCKRAQTQVYMAQRDNGAASVPMWVLPTEDSWRDQNFKYKKEIRALANGTLRCGDAHEQLGEVRQDHRGLGERARLGLHACVQYFHAVGTLWRCRIFGPQGGKVGTVHCAARSFCARCLRPAAAGIVGAEGQ